MILHDISHGVDSPLRQLMFYSANVDSAVYYINLALCKLNLGLIQRDNYDLTRTVDRSTIDRRSNTRLLSWKVLVMSLQNSITFLFSFIGF